MHKSSPSPTCTLSFYTALAHVRVQLRHVIGGESP